MGSISPLVFRATTLVATAFATNAKDENDPFLEHIMRVWRFTKKAITPMEGLSRDLTPLIGSYLRGVMYCPLAG